jgi:hypothetical protein
MDKYPLIRKCLVIGIMLLFIGTVIIPAIAQSKNKTLPTSKGWMKTFGGTQYDYGWSVQQTTDGGYIIIGGTNSFGAGVSDAWLIKTNTNGNKIWDKTFGGSDVDTGLSIQQTSDGGFVITGFTDSFGAGFNDVWLIKTNGNGDEAWNRTFGGINDELGWSIQQTTDDGYIILGYTESFGTGNMGKSDVGLIKTDSQGKSETTSFSNLWFERLFQRFPNAFPILRQLLGY